VRPRKAAGTEVQWPLLVSPLCWGPANHSAVFICTTDWIRPTICFTLPSDSKDLIHKCSPNGHQINHRRSGSWAVRGLGVSLLLCGCPTFQGISGNSTCGLSPMMTGPHPPAPPPPGCLPHRPSWDPGFSAFPPLVSLLVGCTGSAPNPSQVTPELPRQTQRGCLLHPLR
jgi:hypothetical protein